jgi:short chain dehydrogenase
MDPKGHAAIVTGGASGLGAETARYLAKAGARIAVLDVNESAAKSVAAEIGGTAIVCDVSRADSAEAAVRQAREAHGPARILVNCAGIAAGKRIVGKAGPMPLDDFTRIINVNLVGTFNMLRLAAADMSVLEPLEDGERGVIVSTASVAAYEGQLGQAAYAASRNSAFASWPSRPACSSRRCSTACPRKPRKLSPPSFRSLGVWASPPNTRSWPCTSFPIFRSMAKSFASTAPSASLPADRRRSGALILRGCVPREPPPHFSRLSFWPAQVGKY